MRLKRSLLQLDFDEKIILFLHRHPFIFFKKALNHFVFASLPFLVYFILKIYFPSVLENEVIYPLLILLASLWLIFIWISLFNSWIDYYFDIWIVTNKQIIDVEQVGLFNRSLSKQPLTRVQDVTVELKGFFPTFFNYGNIYIQTAGTKERFIFWQVKNPFEVAKKINKLVEEALEAKK